MSTPAKPSFIPDADWQKVLAASSAYGVDPYTIAAIGWHETHWGQLGAGRPSSGSYIFGYGVPATGSKKTQYAGVDAQITATAKRLQDWGTFLGHPVQSLSDLDAFALGASGGPLPWDPETTGGVKTGGAWAADVFAEYAKLNVGQLPSALQAAPGQIATGTAKAATAGLSGFLDGIKAGPIVGVVVALGLMGFGFWAVILGPAAEQS